MTSQPSLMDVLAPPGNRWLVELSHRKGELPPGVTVVRFGGEESVEDDAAETGSRRKKAA